MKAIRIHQHGGPEVMKLEDIPRPVPQEGEVLIKVHAAGVNFIDTYQRSGLYQVQLPYTLGLEAAGEVARSSSPDFKPGDKVVHASAPGAYAEFMLVPAGKLVKIPPGLKPKIAAAAMLQGMTAHYLVHSAYPLKPGDTCVIHAGAGGVGLLLIQMAKRIGAAVIATAGSDDKLRLAKEVGADHTIPYEGFAQKVRELTGGKGVQVVYDGVGKSTFGGSLESLAIRGMLVLYGQASGPVAAFDPQLLNAKGGLFLTRPSLWHYTQTREELEWRANDVMNWAAKGDLKVRIGAEFPLSQAAEAHRKLQGRETTGKVLLIP